MTDADEEAAISALLAGWSARRARSGGPRTVSRLRPWQPGFTANRVLPPRPSSACGQRWRRSGRAPVQASGP